MATMRRDNIRLALKSLGSTKGRSFLTMLGIIIGVAAVIVIISIGAGVSQQIQRQSARYGKNVVVVRAATDKGNSLSGGGFLSAVSASLSSEDLGVVSHTPNVQTVVPLSTITGSVTGDHTVTTPLIVATSSTFPDLVQNKIEYGAFFDPEPDSHTAVLGSAIAQKLFNDNVPLGQSFSLRGQNFIVAGIFSPFIASPFSLEADLNNAIFVPYSTAHDLIKGDPPMYQILVRGSSHTSQNTLINALHKNLVTAHGGADDIVVSSIAESEGNQSAMLRLLTFMTFVTAFITLLVGGIGIMNVMLVSVTERTQEVGLRKAIGATNRQILRQFMMEAAVLGVIGATLGVVLAVAAIGYMHFYTTIQPVIVWQACVIVPLIAIFASVLFGTFPAVKASMKDPIEALRRL